MAITALSYNSTLKITQAVEVDPTLYQDSSVQHGHATTVAVTTGVTKAASFSLAMTVGAATIDLENLTGVNGVAVVGTGLRVQEAKFSNPATNGNPITISHGAANPYDGFGAAFSVELAPGAEVLLRTLDAGSDISATNSDLDLAGTTTQALNCVITLG